MSMIEVKNVTKIFGENPQEALRLLREGAAKDEILAKTGCTVGLRDVSLEIKRGEIFVIMGLSGSGKSTLIRHFNRLIDPTDGQILFEGEDILKYDARRLEAFRREKLGMVFQRFGLMPHRTVLENAAYGLSVRGVPRAEREAKAMEWLKTVGLEGFEKQYPGQLSGGMQQRVGLARALANDPDALLMDEAFSALDPLIRGQMQDQLVELQAQLKKTIVFITHDLDEALRLGDRIAILKDGALVQVGTPNEILLEPADDYVRAFVRDVNRAKVLTVEKLMKPPAHRIAHDDLDRALLDMRKAGETYGFVYKSGAFQGVLTEAALQVAVAEGSSASPADLAQEPPRIEQGSPLAEALPMAMGTDLPLAVMEEDELRGFLHQERIGEVLAVEPAPEPIPEAAPPAPLAAKETEAAKPAA
ncbi:quaternary amine ABC transporter ATP-binding protein [Neomegalonema perideroedes]|uniref:quaternary amine ABC transporter ATP-binding protein n=1 Tax=Neomegalonema perideroedes TaxID=217219 RepID=UPI00035E62D0|nr:glycine betaine/L-proline ABC transporter ATP-binding protein [Neomegalonema perideroedes]